MLQDLYPKPNTKDCHDQSEQGETKTGLHSHFHQSCQHNSSGLKIYLWRLRITVKWIRIGNGKFVLVKILVRIGHIQYILLVGKTRRVKITAVIDVVLQYE